MTLLRFQLLCYFALLLTTVIIGCKFISRSRSDLLVVALVFTGFVTEILSDVFRKLYHNNMSIHHILSPVEFVCIALYYNYAIDSLRKRKIGWMLGIMGVLFAIVNSIFIQDIHSYPSAFLLFETFFIIGLSMYSYFYMFRKEEYDLKKQVLFWITSLMLVYWSFTLVIWGMTSIFLIEAPGYMEIVFPVQYIVNMVYYGGFLIIFLNYKKLIPTGE